GVQTCALPICLVRRCGCRVVWRRDENGGGRHTGFPVVCSSTERSTEEACIVHVPGTGLLGSGHCVVMAGLTFVFQASGIAPNSAIKALPRAGPQSSPGRPPLGQGMASFGFVSWSTENIGTSTYRCAVCLMSPPAGSAVGSVT